MTHKKTAAGTAALIALIVRVAVNFLPAAPPLLQARRQAQVVASVEGVVIAVVDAARVIDKVNTTQTTLLGKIVHFYSFLWLLRHEAHSGFAHHRCCCSMRH